MRIAVTGATGFLGRNLVPALLAEGHRVLRLTRSADPSAEAPTGPGATDAALVLPSDPATIARVVAGCDAIVHLAAAGVSPKRASREDLETINVEGLRSILDGADLAGVPHVLVAGTWAEYGHTLEAHCPVPPSAELRPVWDYAVSKARAFLTACGTDDGPGVGISYVRVFNAFGPHQDPGALWQSLRTAAMDGKDLRLSAGIQVRDFIPVEEVTSHLVAELRRQPDPGTVEVTNCGTGVGRSVREFAEHWWSTWGATGSLLFGEATSRSWDPPCAIAEVGGRWTVTRSSAPREFPDYLDS